MANCTVCRCRAASRDMATCARCRKRKRAWYAATVAAKKAAGLCRFGACPEKAEPGRAKCAHHQKINREQARHYVKGLVGPRPKPVPQADRAKCKTPECTGLRSKCHSVCSSCRYAANIEYYREYQRESFHARRAAGLCVHRGCSAPLAPGRRRCEKHLEQYRVYAYPPRIGRTKKSRTKKTSIVDRLDNYDSIL